MKRNESLISGPIGSALLAFVVPLMLSSLVQQLYVTADAVIVGRIAGKTALAAIDSVHTLFRFPINFMNGLAAGATILISRHFGAENRDGVRSCMLSAGALAVVLGILCAVGGVLLTPVLLQFMQVPEDIYAQTLEYTRIYFGGIWAMILYNMASGVLRAFGNSKSPLYILLVSSIINIVGDILLVGGLGMGTAGAAIATVASQGISAWLGAYMVVKQHPVLHFSREDRKTKPGFVRELLATGLSMAMMSTLYNLGSVIMQGSINALGTVYIAAQVGGRRLAELFYIPGLALGTGTATYASQNYGAGKNTRITRGIRVAILLYGIWWLFALVFEILGASQAVRMITGSDSQEVIENATRYLQVSIPMMPPMGVLIIVRNALQGMRHTLAPLFCSALELIGKVIFALWIIPVKGYFAVCICEPILWILSGILVSVPMYRFYLTKNVL